MVQMAQLVIAAAVIGGVLAWTALPVASATSIDCEVSTEAGGFVSIDCRPNPVQPRSASSRLNFVLDPSAGCTSNGSNLRVNVSCSASF
jgi:hypothetical protein